MSNGWAETILFIAVFFVGIPVFVVIDFKRWSHKNRRTRRAVARPGISNITKMPVNASRYSDWPDAA